MKSASGNLNQLAETAADLRREKDVDISDVVVRRLYQDAEAIAGDVVTQEGKSNIDWDAALDNLLTSKWLGFPIMMLGLGVIFWMTIAGANLPGVYIADFLFWIEDQLLWVFKSVGSPEWLYGFLVLGVYRGLAWVVSVMLPPMAIFFPIFTLLEDFGYLPRVAFNLDRFFQAAGAHGKQALSMAMGFGCNAAAIISTRIIDSPRERVLAILTNNFVPCNGRWPILIVLATIFMGGAVGAAYSTTVAAATVVGLVLVGIAVTLGTSWLLSKTMLRGVPSNFTLELPPYRRPQVVRVFVRSVIDRTLYVLWRAIKVAAPAGAITWILANIHMGEASLLTISAQWLDPFAQAIGLDGFILMAFILGLPANEIVLPILIMGYVSAGTMIELDSLSALRHLLVEEHGWTWVTALCTMLFSLLHYPCGTTLQVIYQETKSFKWAFVSGAMPLAIAITATFIVNQGAHLLGWV